MSTATVEELTEVAAPEPFWTRQRRLGLGLIVFGGLAAVLFGSLAPSEAARFTLSEDAEGAALSINGQFGAILFGMGLTMTRGKHLNSEAVLALARDMNKHTRWVAKPMRGHGNVTGADNVVSWSTGYPFGVNMNRGYPRFNPGEFTTSDVLARGEADAALVYATDVALGGDDVRRGPEVEARRHSPIVYEAGVISEGKGTARARALLEFLVSPAGLEILEKSGFGPPPGAH